MEARLAAVLLKQEEELQNVAESRSQIEAARGYLEGCSTVPWISPAINVRVTTDGNCLKFTYPISNLPARNLLLFHLPEIREWSLGGDVDPLDILHVGCGDVNHFLFTLDTIRPLMQERVSREANSDDPSPFLRFHLMDILPEIVTRDLVVLCCGLWESPAVAFDIWARQILDQRAKSAVSRVIQKLKQLLSPLIRSHQPFPFRNLRVRLAPSRCCVCFHSSSDVEKIVSMMSSWETNQMPVSDFCELRKMHMLRYARKSSPPEDIEELAAIARDVGSALGLPRLLLGEAGLYVLFGGRKETNTREFVNPTFFGLDQEFCVHPSTTPFHPFSWFGEDLQAIEASVQRMFESWHAVADLGHVELHFALGSALKFLDVGRGSCRFDCIYTSNLSDLLGPLNILLCGAKALKPGRPDRRLSFIEIESMKLSSFLPKTQTKVSKDAFLEFCFPFSRDLFSTFLGLELCNDDATENSPPLRSRFNSVRLYFSRVYSERLPVPLRFDFDEGVVLKSLMTLLADIVVYGGTVLRNASPSDRGMAPVDTLETFFRVLDVLLYKDGGVVLQESELRRIVEIATEPSAHAEELAVAACPLGVDVFEQSLLTTRCEFRALTARHFPYLFPSACLVQFCAPYRWKPPAPSPLTRFCNPLVRLSLYAFLPPNAPPSWARVLQYFDVLVLHEDAEGHTYVCFSLLEGDVNFMRGRVNGMLILRTRKTFTPPIVTELSKEHLGPRFNPELHRLASLSLSSMLSFNVVFAISRRFASRERPSVERRDVCPAFETTSDFVCVFQVQKDLIEEDWTVQKRENEVKLSFGSSCLLAVPPFACPPEAIRLQRSRSRALFFVRFQKASFLRVSVSACFQCRLSHAQQLQFVLFSPWVAFMNEGTIEKLSCDCFTMKEAVRSKCLPNPDSDYLLRNKIFCLYNAALRNRTKIAKITENPHGEENHHWQWLVSFEEVRCVGKCPILRVLFTEIFSKDQPPEKLAIGSACASFIFGRRSEMFPGLVTSIASDRVEQTALHAHLSALSFDPPPEMNAPQGIRSTYLFPLCPLTRYGSLASIQSAVLRICAQCGAEKAKKKCSRCLVTYYCSRRCQRLHWKFHKNECHQQ